MADGDFATAERKLIKALDHRPDDGELWWSLMLCKFGFKNDAELESAVKDKYNQAAENDESPPPTPFDTSYCKNAIKYATTNKRIDFVTRVNAELSDIWKEKRGRALKTKTPKKKTYSKPDVLKIALYATTCVAAVGGFLGAYSVFAHATWALWTGFILLILFSAAAFFIRGAYKKSGGTTKLADILLVAVFAATGAALLVAGIVKSNQNVIILAVAVLVLSVTLGVYRLLSGGRAEEKSGSRQSKKSGQKTKAAYDRSNVLAAQKDHNKKTGKGRQNVYRDQDD